MQFTRSNQFGVIAATLRQPINAAAIKNLLLSKTVLTVIDQAAFSASNFLTAVIVARHSSAEHFGLYILGLRLVDYCREIQNVMIWSPYMLFSPRFQDAEHARYTGSTLAHQIFSCGLVALIFLSAWFVLPPTFNSFMLPLALVGVFFPLQEYARRICFANFHFVAVVMLDVAVTVIQLAGLYFCAMQNQMSVRNAYWIIGAANGIATLVWLVWARSFFVFEKSRFIPDFKMNWEQGKWLLGGNVTLLAASQIFPWTLTTFHGAAATGIYAAGEGIVNFIRAFMISIQNFLGPKLAHAYARGGKHALKQVVYQTTILLGVITGACAALFALFGGNLATLVYGEKFVGLRWVIAFLAFNIFLGALTTSQSYALSTIERSDVNFKINILGLILSMSLGLALTIQYGALGAALGLGVSNLLTAFVRQIVFARFFKQEVA